MKEEIKKSGDILGIAPYGEAIKIAVEKGFDGAQAVLGRICLPAAEELGLLFQDNVRHWRLNNIIKIVEKSEGLIDFSDNKLKLSAHPRVVKEIIHNGSWCDDDTLQDMWAGLIAASCEEVDSNDDGNLLFVDTLKGLTSRQATILNYLCENCEITVDKHGLIMAKHIVLGIDDLERITGTNNLQLVDTELDNLRSRELIMEGGSGIIHEHAAGLVFGKDAVEAHLEPSPFAIALYVKAKGFNGSPKEYFNLKYIPKEGQDSQN